MAYLDFASFLRGTAEAITTQTNGGAARDHTAAVDRVLTDRLAILDERMRSGSIEATFRLTPYRAALADAAGIAARCVSRIDAGDAPLAADVDALDALVTTLADTGTVWV